MDLGISGRKALVCGASKGLGLAAAIALAKEGCQVTIVGRTPANLEKALVALRVAGGPSCSALCLDLNSSSAVEAFIVEQGNFLRQVDILVNNTGGPAPTAAEKTSLGDWRAGFDSLFLSAVRLSQTVAEGMGQRRWGRVINITSIAVVEPIEQLAVSASMRAGVTAFAKLLATELAPRGITVNNVMPGIIHTDRIDFLRKSKASRDGTTYEAEMERTIAAIPAKRLGRPDELGDLVAFLASDRAGFLTGCSIGLDGGLRKSY